MYPTTQSSNAFLQDEQIQEIERQNASVVRGYGQEKWFQAVSGVKFWMEWRLTQKRLTKNGSSAEFQPITP
jgi:hypothetical protein